MIKTTPGKPLVLHAILHCAFARITSTGGRSYLQIKESLRDADGKPRLRVVANLGHVDQLEDGSLDALIRGLSRVAGREVQEKVKGGFQSTLSCGEVFALHAIWKDLSFDRALARALRSG